MFIIYHKIPGFRENGQYEKHFEAKEKFRKTLSFDRPFSFGRLCTRRGGLVFH